MTQLNNRQMPVVEINAFLVSIQRSWNYLHKAVEGSCIMFVFICFLERLDNVMDMRGAGRNGMLKLT